MSKDLAKLFLELKEELKAELENFKDAAERNVRSEERSLRTELGEMKVTLCENKQLKKENESLRTTVFTLEKDLVESQASLLKSEQYTRNRNLEIKGIEQTENEDLKQLFEKIGEKLEEPITESDVDICHRVPTKNEGKSNIIVQFQCREKRDKVLQMARKKRLTTTLLGLPTDFPVYINEHLCPTMKKILGRAVARKREHGWKFVWTRDGSVFARRIETSCIVAITCENDLNKICADISV
ncbi:uncharacterized protein LOC144167853 [Haemaphysalis longicornis]